MEWWFDEKFKECLNPCPRSKDKWDCFFMNIAELVSSLSKCASRKVGAVITRGNQILATGYNGSPAGTSFCQRGEICPRKVLGFGSGERLDLCPAQHAEANAIYNCARNGISCLGTTLYLNTVMPCKNCAGAIINAGIKEVIYLIDKDYDIMAKILFNQAEVLYRTLSGDEVDE